MARLQTSFVLGYHGCRQSVADQILKEDRFNPSKNAYDWLGHGIYFWEANPRRALGFASEVAHRKGWQESFAVVGAVIDLGNCLDLASDEGIFFVRSAYASLIESLQAEGKNLPENNKQRGTHNLDCAVINRIHKINSENNLHVFDTVRGIFQEGGEIYQGSAFREKTHVQIAVVNPATIKGIFRVAKEDSRG